MISDERLHHSLAVARKCYDIALGMGKSLSYCEKAWLVGYLHDIGYEFSDSNHERDGASILSRAGLSSEIVNAIKNHDSVRKYSHTLHSILILADLQTMPDGRYCDVMTRLEDIKARYGEYSKQYIGARDNASLLGLI